MAMGTKAQTLEACPDLRITSPVNSPGLRPRTEGPKAAAGGRRQWAMGTLCADLCLPPRASSDGDKAQVTAVSLHASWLHSDPQACWQRCWSPVNVRLGNRLWAKTRRALGHRTQSDVQSWSVCSHTYLGPGTRIRERALPTRRSVNQRGATRGPRGCCRQSGKEESGPLRALRRV